MPKFKTAHYPGANVLARHSFETKPYIEARKLVGSPLPNHLGSTACSEPDTEPRSWTSCG